MSVKEEFTWTTFLQGVRLIGGFLPNSGMHWLNTRCNTCFFFWDITANYGPILAQKRLERQTSGLRKSVDEVLNVKPDPNPGGAVQLDQPWPSSPSKFRAQFASIFDTEDLKEIKLGGYLHELIRFKLIESDRPGLGASNSYYFLDHPWMREGQPEAPASAGQDRQDSSTPDRTDSSGLERQGRPAPTIEENQVEKNQEKRKNIHKEAMLMDFFIL